MLEVSVEGEPIGQGAIRHLGKGRPAIHANGKRLKPWRTMVALATQQRMAEIGLVDPLDGPLGLSAEFHMPRPKTVRRLFPTVPPDIDHLVRALCDALKQAGAVVDDSRIVRLRIDKEYETASNGPGVWFRLHHITEEDE